MGGRTEGGHRSPSNAQLEPLTSLRFIAAAIVVLFHVAPRHLPKDSWAAGVLQHGWCSVYFFFTLSGFVIGCVYADSKVSAARFWTLRAFRILPLHLFALLILIPWNLEYFPQWYSHENVYLVVASTVLLLHGWTSYWEILNYPSWSLSTEALFYAVFPAINAGLRRVPRTRTLLALALAFIAIHLAVALAPPLTGDACPQQEECMTTLQLWMHGPLGGLSFFFAGVALGRIFVDEQRCGITRNGNAYFIAGLVATIGIFWLRLDRWDGLVTRAALAIPFAILVFGAAHARGSLHRVLSARPLVYLGDISYSFYLLQVPVLYFTCMAMGIPMWETTLPALFAYLAGLLVASMVTYRLVESPFRELGRRLIRRTSS
ncbi:MAG: acyltransferase [Kofleriaceae bacterium]|nr:acyltransferase [Kofleriaceae bacterium]